MAASQATPVRRSNPGTPFDPWEMVRDERDRADKLQRLLFEQKKEPETDAFEVAKWLHEVSKPNPAVEFVDALADRVPELMGSFGKALENGLKIKKLLDEAKG